MSIPDALLDESAEDLFETAPCGYLTTAIDGTILRVNRTFEELTGRKRADLLGRRRFQELLTPGGRIYHETHYAPLLRMQGIGARDRGRDRPRRTAAACRRWSTRSCATTTPAGRA